MEFSREVQEELGYRQVKVKSSANRGIAHWSSVSQTPNESDLRSSACSWVRCLEGKRDAMAWHYGSVGSRAWL
jgi:hypothetical protein